MDRELEQANKSLFFLTVLLGSILLSWRALWLQREGIRQEREVDVSGLRRTAGALVVLALSFFFSLALQGRREAAGTAGAHAASTELLAALLVLLAALLRLGQQLMAQKTPPPTVNRTSKNGQ